MSEMKSVETRGEAKRATSDTILGLIQIVAGVGAVLGVCATIYESGGWGSPVAFMAFVVFLMARGVRRQ